MTPKNLRLLEASSLFSSLKDDTRQNLLSSLSVRSIEAGGILFDQGATGEGLFVILDGEFTLLLEGSSRDSWVEMQRRTIGDTLGDFAFLNRSYHLVRSQAIRSCLVAELPRSTIDTLDRVDPSVRRTVYESASELARRVMLARLYIDLLGDVEERTLQRLLDASDVNRHRSGDVLYEAGARSDGLHFVVSGRLVAERPALDGGIDTVREFRAPDVVGVGNLLSGVPHGEALYASRASVVAHLPLHALDEIVLDDGRMVATLSRRLLERTSPPELGFGRSTVVQPRTFALVLGSEDEQMRSHVYSLLDEMNRAGPVELLSADRFDHAFGVAGAARLPSTDLLDRSMSRWFDHRERRHDATLYLVDGEIDAWAERVVNRADRILFVAHANSDPAQLATAVERIRAFFREGRHAPPVELTLLHERDVEQPSGTDAWLERIQPSRFHHVRQGSAKHIESLARRLGSRERGLVLSSGGARGYAHLGLQHYLEQHELDVDHVGGTSMGALLGAGIALGRSHAAITELSDRFANRRALFDYTLPLVAIMSSKKLTTFCQHVCGDTMIEDMWTPFFAMSADLSDGTVRLHDRGPLWLAVRSSISLPGLFSPVPTADGALLVDGAVLDGFPVAQMRRRLGGLGEVIGCNVSRQPEPMTRFAFGSHVSGWHVLRSRLSPFRRRIETPRAIETLLRSTDVKDIRHTTEQRELCDILIEPDVSDYELLDFQRFRDIAAIGYEATRRVLTGETTRNLAASRRHEAAQSTASD